MFVATVFVCSLSAVLSGCCLTFAFATSAGSSFGVSLSFYLYGKTVFGFAF